MEAATEWVRGLSDGISASSGQAVLVVILSLALPLLFTGIFRSSYLPKIDADDDDDEGRSKKNRRKNEARDVSEKLKAAIVARRNADGSLRIEDEPWYPHLEVVDWQKAGQVEGCPWSFEGCENLDDVFARVWRTPEEPCLRESVEILRSKTRHIKVARCAFNTEEPLIHHVLIYVLHNGAELFGGRPLDLINVLEIEDVEDVEGLRRRGGHESPKRRLAEGLELPIPNLAPFYKVHDGFGVLISNKALPLLVLGPHQTVAGSCYYIYPINGIVSHGLEDVLKFARIDGDCVACTNVISGQKPRVFFAEANGEVTEDDEDPLAFVADTLANLSGYNVAAAAFT